MMDSTLSPEPQRTWVFVSLSLKFDTHRSQVIHNLLFYNESTPHFLPNLSPFSFSVLPFLLMQSPADQCKKIHAGDEVIQVNHQTVVSTKRVASKHKTVLTKNPRKCTFHVFTLWIHTANCLLFSILCYIEELSRYTVPATTTTTTAAMMLPVLCLVLLCRLIRLAAGVDYRTIVTRPLFSPVWLSVHSFWNLFQLS